MREPHSRYLKALGARILSEANDLKRTPDALARELGRDPAEIAAVIAGVSDVETAQGVVREMAARYPVAFADLWLDPLDTESGVVVVTAAQSAATSRVFERPNATGRLSPYYEYRDTAMSRGAPYKPEWIKELRTVADDNPGNPELAYNKGHLMHQVTYFVGEVNFYWEAVGERHSAEMNTGDSAYISPFVPHTFASRNPAHAGHIIAVTYSDGLRRAINSISHLSAGDLASIVPRQGIAHSGFSAQLARHASADHLEPSQLAARAGISETRIRALLAGAAPERGEVAVLAAALGIREQDLHLSASTPPLVVLGRARDVQERGYPDGNAPSYRFRDLARPVNQPGLKAFEISVFSADSAAAVMSHSLHEYLYVLGDQQVLLYWGADHMRELAPGDSVYVAPFVPHKLAAPGGTGRVLSIRLMGALTDAVLEELGSYAPGSLERVVQEHTRWF